MPCGREINDPPLPALLHLTPRRSRSVVPNFNPQRARRAGAPLSSSAVLPWPPSLPPPSSSTSAFLFLYLCPPRNALAGLPFSPVPAPVRSFHHPSAASCLLDQRPGDGTTRKAGFKIIMARAILITVARTTTISGWHYHYHYHYEHRPRHCNATDYKRCTLFLPVRLISHCTYREVFVQYSSAIDVRSGLCEDITALNSI